VQVDLDGRLACEAPGVELDQRAHLAVGPRSRTEREQRTVRKFHHAGQSRQRFQVCLRGLALQGPVRQAARQHGQQRARLAALGGKHAELMLIVRDDVETILDAHQPTGRAQVTRTSRCRRGAQSQLAKLLQADHMGRLRLSVQ